MQPSKTLPATEVCLQGGAVTLTESLYNPYASYAPPAPSTKPSQLQAPLRAPRPGPPTPRPAAPPRKAAPATQPPTATNRHQHLCQRARISSGHARTSAQQSATPQDRRWWARWAAARAGEFEPTLRPEIARSKCRARLQPSSLRLVDGRGRPARAPTGSRPHRPPRRATKSDPGKSAATGVKTTWLQLDRCQDRPASRQS